MSKVRFTKIVATIGPKTSSPEAITELLRSGVNVLRLNLSHGSHAGHAKVIRAIRSSAKKLACSPAIMIDTKGPEIRTKDVPRPTPIKRGQTVLFSGKRGSRGTRTVIRIDHPRFASDVRGCKTILIDNGVLEFAIVKIGRDGVLARALEDGSIGSRRHVNVPGAVLSLPSFTKQDWSDVAFAIRQRIDFIALSFVRSASDIELLKRKLRSRRSEIEIVAKIETNQAIHAIGAIVGVADSVMVARGDLGAEIPFENVPRLQEEIVRECRKRGKPVIIATHMLESMIERPTPTRAEVTDVAHAAESQADATMLSGETATGKFPVQAVRAMHRILTASEKQLLKQPTMTSGESLKDEGDLPRQEQAMAASLLAAKLRARALLVISKHGLTARALSHCRPHVPIIAFTTSDETARHLQLVWGITPFSIHFSSKPDRTVTLALKVARDHALLKKGDRIVIVSDIRSARRPVMSIQIRKVE